MGDQQRFIELVDQMLLINQKDNEISNVEPKIDQLVYEL